MNFCTVVRSHFIEKCVIKILEEILFTDKRKICFTTLKKVIWFWGKPGKIRSQIAMLTDKSGSLKLIF